RTRTAVAGVLQDPRNEWCGTGSERIRRRLVMQHHSRPSEMLYLHSIGHFHPENLIDNGFLESLNLGIDSEWIIQRVGIRSRRTVLPLDYIRYERNQCLAAAAEATLYTNAQTGAKATRMALDRARLRSDDIGLVISGSSAPRLCSP